MHFLYAAALAGALLAPIEDQEPAVTREVDTLLHALADGSIGQANLTDKARAALLSPQGQADAARLRQCGQWGPLTLMERTVFGEDRRYLYRLDCHGVPLLATVHFNKAARLDRMTIAPQ